MTNEFNPEKSLFGRHNYAFEQAILRQVMNESDKSFAAMDPEIVRLNLPLIKLVPFHKRREMVLKRLDNSIKLLESMGV